MPLGRIGRRFEFAKGVEYLLELIARVAAEGVLVHDQRLGLVERWMSKVELVATQKTGLPRGGEDGTHCVTDAANADPLRARQRFALPQTHEVRVTVEVPNDALSVPSTVDPAFNRLGDGMQRTTTGDVPVRVIKAD
jgi:hypothetical protein